MKISVITVCFNSEKTIEDTIKSVQSQTYPDIEYVVIDGGSRDRTNEIIERYSDIVSIHVSEADEGLYDAMNKGIQKATGDVIGILNSDDFYENPSVITEVISQFISKPESSLVFGDVVFVEPSNIEKIVRYYDSRKFKAWKLRFGWMPPHTASFIKRSAYKQVGNYSLDYRIAADYELFVRMLMVHKLSYTRMNKVLVRMSVGGLSTSGIKSSLLLNSEIVKACKCNGIYTNLFLVLLKIPLKLLERLKKPKDIA
ncbi:MAG: glycosyltransferase involved in cell wall biosynthesis [Oleiphilaceae bacterium]|jgi:glycosyltransferase involved in cell wall biosynthesis